MFWFIRKVIDLLKPLRLSDQSEFLDDLIKHYSSGSSLLKQGHRMDRADMGEIIEKAKAVSL